AYQTLAVGSLEEAEARLAELEASGTPLALVVTDHVLGRRTGLDLPTPVHDRFRDVLPVLLPGQAPPRIERAARAVGARVIWKPLRLSQLIGQVTELLAG